LPQQPIRISEIWTRLKGAVSNVFTSEKWNELKGAISKVITPERRTKLKKTIPLMFAAMAPLAYLIVTLRVIFKVPITRFVPVFIDPFHLFILLMVILSITVVANSVKRYKIRSARAKGAPIWNKEVGRN